ncbi:hypothetical protein SFUMM280S_09008 [Streptomyces fumanus]
MVKRSGSPGVRPSRYQRWMGVSGASAGAVVPVVAGADSVTRRASSATVWWRKTSLVVSARPAWRARETIWMLRIESPPSVKKLSRAPTRSTCSTSAQIAASVCSVPGRGGT